MGTDHLPREVAADTETTKVGFKAKLFRRPHLMAYTEPHKGIDPFKISARRKCHSL